MTLVVILLALKIIRLYEKGAVVTKNNEYITNAFDVIHGLIYYDKY